MMDLSLSQKYALCVLNEKGKIPAFQMEGSACLLAAALLEMQMDGAIRIENKKIRIRGELADGKEAFRPIYDYLDAPKPRSIDKVTGEFLVTFTNKKLNALLDSVCAPLAEQGLVAPEPGFLGSQTHYIPDTRAVGLVIDGLRAELLEEGEISEDAAMLAVLLERSNLLKTYFSKFEQGQIRERLKALEQGAAGQVIREVTACIDAMITTIAVVLVTH